MTAGEAYEKAVVEQKRLPELEYLVLQDAYYAFYYAKNVIKERWCKAEPIIMQDAYLAYKYACDVIKGRWSEAEPTIMQFPLYTYRYALNIIKGRWLEAEPIIAKSNLVIPYIRDFFDEPVVTKDKVDIIEWERKKQVGYFAPARLFKNKVSLLDIMVIE